MPKDKDDVYKPPVPRVRPPAWYQYNSTPSTKPKFGRGGAGANPFVPASNVYLNQPYQPPPAFAEGPSTFFGGGGDVQGPTGAPVQVTPTPRNKPPAWLPTRPARSVEGPSSFFGGGGDVVRGPTGAPVSTSLPTGSFIGGGGNYVMGSNLKPYYIGPEGPNTFIGGGGEAVRGPWGEGGGAYWLPKGPAGPNTFIGAGGEAVRGPDYPAPLQPPTTGGGGGGFGTNYNWKRRGGGRGGYGGGYGGSYGGSDYIPPWMMGLYSWNFKG